MRSAKRTLDANARDLQPADVGLDGHWDQGQASLGLDHPAASTMVPPELRHLDPTYADNMARQIIMSDA
jgi:hypothetical protein